MKSKNKITSISKRGGARAGAGRPSGQGKYQEPTKPIRVPISVIGQVVDFLEEKANQKNLLPKFVNKAFSNLENASFLLPLYHNSVPAGFPSPADDHISERVDLNNYLVKHPSATFLVRVVGDSMVNAGINQNDILVVDRSLEARDGRIVIAAINGELTVKRLNKTTDGTFLMPENESYPPIKLEEHNENLIWGVVTNVIHKV